MKRHFNFDRRGSGLLLHLTSLPGPHFSGDLGDQAYRFVDFLTRGGGRCCRSVRRVRRRGIRRTAVTRPSQAARG
jgi:hypothetical protein